MTTLTLPALSIRQPWAWAITTLGKDVENRTWRSWRRGPFLIHAGKGLRMPDIADFLATVERSEDLKARLAAAGGLNLDALKAMTGGIVGMAEITGYVGASAPEAKSPWFFGPWGFTLAKACPLAFHPCPGQLGFFEVAMPIEDNPPLSGLPKRPFQERLLA
ncbi:hypothetical protein [Methylobacterium aquaticum]|uniref:ASCH domain-containing protein n=1 Tax=Methylobacterium aquaticum TaxID=270351 RepID=A0A0C6FQ03_9HYPH|nr:hypothetical protein [Methylobacterium aquaticum]BAQ50373.1 hypothetical protein Maq22A_4p60080 [Methylobacterium aquaticum]